MTGLSIQPQVVESYDDGTYMWQMGKEFACSWDSAFTLSNGPLPRIVTPWLPTIAAARLAWEMSKPARPTTGFGMAQVKREGTKVLYD